jgi:hypothetical protein
MFVVSFFVSLNAFLAVPSVADAQVAPSCTIAATPNPVVSGGSITLNWSSQNGTAASLTDFGTVGLNGSVTLTNVTTGKTYILQVTNGTGSVSCSTQVTIGSSNNNNGIVPTCSIEASNAYVGRNQPVQLSWNTSNGVSAAISNLGGVQLNGSTTVYPQSTTTYILTVTGNGASNSCSRTVTVDQNYTGVPKCTLGADPVLIYNNTGSTTLTWTTQDATNVSIAGIGTVAANGSYTVYGVSGPRTYVLTATGVNGTRTCTETVFGQGTTGGYYGSNFVQQVGSQSTTGTPENPGCYIDVSPKNVGTGNAVLSWNAAGAYAATISGIGSVATSGTNAITPKHTTTYTLTAFGANGVTRTCSTTATVAGTIDPYTYASNAYLNNYYNGAYSNSTYSDVVDTRYTYGKPHVSVYSQYNYGSSRGRNVVALNDVPYTGAADVFGALFSLVSAITAGYGATKLRLA